MAANINALIGSGGRGVTPPNEAQNALMAQRVAQQDTEMQDYAAQAPRREQAEKVEDSDNKMAFLKDRIALVNDQQTLQTMRDEAVSIWGQTADDNMPATYDQESFDKMRSHLGVSSVSDREKFNQAQAFEEGKNTRYKTLRASQEEEYKKRIEQDKQDIKAGMAQEIAENTKRGAVIGAEQADEAIALPKAIEAADYSLALLDKVRNHPGREISTGKSFLAGKAAAAVPGTEAKDFSVLMDQVAGEQFMQAFQGLKGGGQITEIEGQKATQAVARLNMAQSENEFMVALDELQDVIERGVARKQRGVAVLPDGSEVPEAQFSQQPVSVDDEALSWARQNPADPRAKKIMNARRNKGL